MLVTFRGKRVKGKSYPRLDLVSFLQSGIHPKPIIIFIGLLLIQQQQQQHIRVANIRKADFSIEELRCHGAAKIRKQVTITSFSELLRLICGQLL